MRPSISAYIREVVVAGCLSISSFQQLLGCLPVLKHFVMIPTFLFRSVVSTLFYLLIFVYTILSSYITILLCLIVRLLSFCYLLPHFISFLLSFSFLLILGVFTLSYFASLVFLFVCLLQFILFVITHLLILVLILCPLLVPVVPYTIALFHSVYCGITLLYANHHLLVLIFLIG
jgi:hypothetical protein